MAIKIVLTAWELEFICKALGSFEEESRCGDEKKYLDLSDKLMECIKNYDQIQK